MTEETAKLYNDMSTVLDEICYMARTERDRLEDSMDKGQHPNTFEYNAVCIALQAFAQKGQELVQ